MDNLSIGADVKQYALEKLLNTTPADYAAVYRNIFGNLLRSNTGANSRRRVH